MRQLNGWQRIALIFSAAWVVLAGMSVWLDETRSAIDVAVMDRQSCIAANKAYSQSGLYAEDCDETFSRTKDIFLQHRLLNSILMAIVPLIFFWLIFLGVRFLFLWIKKGFDAEA